MAIEVIDFDDALEDNGLKILVHGPAGAGKTVLAATAASGGFSTILLSAESGLLSLKKVFRENPEFKKLIKIIKIKSFQDLKETREWFEEEDQMSDFLDLDSISEIAEQILTYEKENSKDPRQAYGELTNKMLEELRSFRDLPGYNVMMTCKQAREVDQDTERTRYVPMFPGRQVGPAVPYLFDEVFALRVEEDDDGDEYRTLQTNRDSQYEAKDRSGELEMFEPPNLAKILKKINPEYVRLKDRDADDIPKSAKAKKKAEKAAKKESKKKGKKKPKNHDKEKHDDPILGKKKMYWHHDGSGDFFSTKKGDDITRFIAEPDCNEMSMKDWSEAKKKAEDE